MAQGDEGALGKRSKYLSKEDHKAHSLFTIEPELEDSLVSCEDHRCTRNSDQANNNDML